MANPTLVHQHLRLKIHFGLFAAVSVAIIMWLAFDLIDTRHQLRAARGEFGTAANQ